MKFRIDDKKIYSSLEEAVDEALKTKKEFSLEMLSGHTIIIKIDLNAEAGKANIMRALQIQEIISRLFLIKDMFIAIAGDDGFLKNNKQYEDIIENFKKKFSPISNQTLQGALQKLYMKGSREELYQYLNEPKSKDILDLFQEEIEKLEIVALFYDKHKNDASGQLEGARELSEIRKQQKVQQSKTQQDKTSLEKLHAITATAKQPKTNTTTKNNQSVNPERVVAEGTVKKQPSQKTLSEQPSTSSNQVKEFEKVLKELRQDLTQTVNETDVSANPISKKPLTSSEQHNLVSKALAELLSTQYKDLPLAQKKGKAKKIIEGLLPEITSNKELLRLSELIEKKHTTYAYLREEQSWWRFQSHGNTSTWSAIIGDIKTRMDENIAGCENETYSKKEYKQFLTIMNEHRGRGFGSVTHSKMYRQLDEIPADEEQIHIKPFK